MRVIIGLQSDKRRTLGGTDMDIQGKFFVVGWTGLDLSANQTWNLVQN